MSEHNSTITSGEVAAYCRSKSFVLEMQGGELRGPCPVHKGSNPSFSINPSTGEWYCHSKCGRGGNIFDLEQATTDADAKFARAEVLRIVGRGTEPERKIVAEYDYTDEQDNILYQCVRFEPKDFRQRRLSDDARWIWNLDGVRLVLYRLPQVLAAETVHVCEGEKDVHTLENFGLVATCSPMGAGKWRPEYANYLRGKRVIILPDNDEPGRKHALAVAQSLLDVAASVRIVEVTLAS